MANKRALAVVLGAAALLAAPALLRAQPANPGYFGPDQPVVQPVAQPAASQPLPGDPDYVEPAQGAREKAQAEQQQETVKISAPRYKRLHEARFPGSPNRGNPMRTFPGELPEKNAYSVPWGLDGIVVEDARQSQALPTLPGHVAAPDTLNP